MKTLMGFDFIEYLKRHFMLGQVDPWRQTFDDKPIFTILVSLETAYDECKYWSKQDFSKTEFTNYLKLNDIYLFKNIENFVDAKEEKKVKKGKRELSPEHRKALSERMKSIRRNRSKNGDGANQVNTP